MGTNLNGTYFYVKHQKTILNFYAKEKKGERERKRQLDDWISSRGDGAQTEIWSWMIWKVNKVLIPFKLDHLKNKIWLLSIKIGPRNIAKTRILFSKSSWYLRLWLSSFYISTACIFMIYNVMKKIHYFLYLLRIKI